MVVFSFGVRLKTARREARSLKQPHVDSQVSGQVSGQKYAHPRGGTSADANGATASSVLCSALATFRRRQGAIKTRAGDLRGQVN